MARSCNILFVLPILLVCFIVSGCAVGFYKGRPSDKVKIEELQDELERLREAKSLLEKRLKSEIDSNQVALTMEDRGLVITFVAEVLFDSGKDKLKPGGERILQKVGNVIKEETVNNEISVEGHTDNVPIKYSGWKSNWELSTARATSVLHYLEDNCGLMSDKLSATGYGEYRPVTSNETEEGKQANRRVEIIIKPLLQIKVQYEEAEEDTEYIK
jgi:chemotaxis protein MotB